MPSETGPVRFDTKIAVLLRDDLLTWQRLNVTAFLVSGLGSALPEVIGAHYADADGVGYLPMFRQPVLVFESAEEQLRAAESEARDLLLRLPNLPDEDALIARVFVSYAAGEGVEPPRLLIVVESGHFVG